MKKKTLAFLLLASPLLLTSCVEWGTSSDRRPVAAEQPVKTEQRSVAALERILLAGSPTVYYTQADSVSVRVEGPADQLAFVETVVRDSCLSIRMKDQFKQAIKKLRINGGDDITVYVTSPDLISVSLIGSGDFICEGPLDTDQLNIDLRGAGDIRFGDIICDRLVTSLVGSGDVEVKHVVALSSDMELVGSGEIDIHHDRVRRTDILLKGSGDIDCEFFDCGDVFSELWGSGDIKLSGVVRSLGKKVNRGSGVYETSELMVKE